MSAAELQDQTYPPPDQDLVAGRYRLEERIGKGRLGDIFDAVDTKHRLVGDEQHVALQMVSDLVGRSNALFNKLRIGYQSLQAAGHPNIVQYGNLGRDGSTIYLVMERLEGAPLSALLDDAGTLPLDEVLPVLRGVGDALRFLHYEDLVHGNLTAGNVFITNQLDIRLLDVVPSSAASAIFRGKTTSNSNTRPAAADDVFGLAFLAYRMLAGRDPFDDGNPVRIEPKRISGLADHQWEALRRALTRDEEQQAYPVADFLRDFGVRGNERLQAAAISTVAVQQAPQPEPADSAPPEPEPADSLPPMTAEEPASVQMEQPLDIDGWSGLEPDAPGTRPWRAVLLTVLLAGLAAWAYFGEPEEPIVDLIAYLDSSLDLGIAEPVIVVEPPTSQPIASEPVVTNDAMFEPEPVETSAAVQPAVEQPETQQSEAGQPVPAADVVTADAEPVAEPETLQTEQVEAAAAPVTEPVAEGPAADELEEAGFAGPVVAVFERSAVARVSLPADAGSGLPLVWWTSEHTARANADFIPVPEQLVDIASGDTLTVQLVNDNVPEQQESFYVDVGVRQPQGNIERVTTIRVDIVDDD